MDDRICEWFFSPEIHFKCFTAGVQQGKLYSSQDTTRTGVELLSFMKDLLAFLTSILKN